MACDKILSITFELECLTVILADKITNSSLCKTDTRTELRGELPFKFLWRGINGLEGRRRGF